MISCPNIYSFLWMKWKDDSLLWENVHMFMQIFIYNLITVLNYTKMYFYCKFEGFFSSWLLSSPCCLQVFWKCSWFIVLFKAAVGNNLLFLVAMRSLLSVFSEISLLKSPLYLAFVSTAPGRCDFSAHEVLQILGREGAQAQNISSASGHNEILWAWACYLFVVQSQTPVHRGGQRHKIFSFLWDHLPGLLPLRGGMRLGEGKCWQCQPKAFSLCCFSGPRALSAAVQPWTTGSPLFYKLTVYKWCDFTVKPSIFVIPQPEL